MHSELTGEENIHVVNNIVLKDDQQAERQEGRILQDHIENNAPNIDATAAVLAAIRLSVKKI